MTNAPELVEGYPTIANGMGLMPETAILRRFATLNTQSLLYRQAEIIRLERELRALEARSHHTKPAADDPEPNNEYWYAKDWYYLGVQRPQNEQWQKFLVVQNKLEEYSKLPLVRDRFWAALTMAETILCCNKPKWLPSLIRIE